MLRFSNDKVRVLHMLPTLDSTYAGIFNNDSPTQGTRSLSFAERRRIILRTTVDFQAKIESNFKDDKYLKGLRSYTILFSS